MYTTSKVPTPGPTPTVHMSSQGFHRAQSWFHCFFLLIIMTCQTHSGPQIYVGHFADDILLYRTVNGAKDKLTHYYRKTLQLSKNGNVFGR